MAKADGVKPRPKPTGKKAPAAKDEKSQSERFIETARELGVDETGNTFDHTFRKLVPPIGIKSPKGV
jgi:hypothetical protein